MQDMSYSMEKLAYSSDNPFATRNLDVRWTKKDKIIGVSSPIIGAAVMAGLAASGNKKLKKSLENAKQRKENAKTERSKQYWQKNVDDLEKRTSKKSNIVRTLGAATIGAMYGSLVPIGISTIKDHNITNRIKADEWEAAKNSNRYYDFGNSQSHSRDYDFGNLQNDINAYDILKGFGSNTQDFTTKKEFNSWYRKQAKKYHPDLHPDEAAVYTEKMKDFNSKMDTVKKSRWYEHLAFLMDNGFEKEAMGKNCKRKRVF